MVFVRSCVQQSDGDIRQALAGCVGDGDFQGAGGGVATALIALARAELVDPDVLLFDEATAALDPATEAAVLAAGDRVVSRRTAFVVAHRLATAARADRVVVLDGGRIVEQGTHADLVDAGGPYARLWRAGELEPAA